MTTRNDVTGDFIRSKKSNDNYRSGWDAAFGKKQEVKEVEEEQKQDDNLIYPMGE